MLLLITDSDFAQEKKETYTNILPVDSVMLASSIPEATQIISHDNRVNIVVINRVLIEDIKVEEAELKNLADEFNGVVIMKVDDELFGISLIKQGLISDFYLSSDDKDIELSRLEKAFKVANSQKIVSCNLASCKVTLDTLERVTNGSFIRG